MTIWAEFANAAPELASRGRALIERHNVVLLGTNKRDGWPRITALEPVMRGAHLALGMPRTTMKARDLIRDPRCTIHSATASPDGDEGEFIVYGRAIEMSDDAEYMADLERHFDRIGWRPPEPYYQFTIDIDRAWFVRHREATRWP